MLPAANGLTAEETIEPVFKGILEPCCREASSRAEPAAPPEGTFAATLPGDRSPAMEKAPSPPTRRRFNGLNRSQALPQDNDEALPADTSIAAGETRVLQAANSALRFSGFSGREPVVKSLNEFFDVPDAPLLAQPRVYYDRMAKRFYVAALSVDPESQESAIHIAFSSIFVDVDNLELSRTFQDGGTWCAYRMPVDFAAGPPVFASSLALGQNESWIALTTDHFRYSDGAFRISSIHAIDKLSLSHFVSGPCPTISFARLNVRRDGDGKRAMALQPVQHYTNNALPGRALYLLSTQTLFNSSDVYTLWRLEGGGTDSLTLSRVSLQGDFVYSQPPPAPQRNGPELDTGDTRITQAAFRDGKVWAVHATGCQVGQPPEESCLRLVEITPDEMGGELTHQENLGRRNLFLWAPGLAVNHHGDVLVPFLRSQAGLRLATGYVVRRAARGSFDALRNLSNGQCPLMSFDGQGRNLTGRSAGAQTDPVDDFGFWVAGEFPANLAGLGCDWRTRGALVRDQDPPRRTPIVLARGEFLLPTAENTASDHFEMEVELDAVAPGTGLADTAGRRLVVALRDVSRPDATCVRDVLSNGCASIDYPLDEPSLRNTSWVSVDLVDGRSTFYLAESQDLSLVPDPMKPD